MFYVYIIKSDKGYTYIGQTNNIEERISRHNSGREKYTKNKGFFKLIHEEIYKTRSEAMRREKELKSGKGREWIKNNIL